MGREGPCFHCGIEKTPLWRHGPAEKPVLCNACGSRWRIRSTLDDYIPKHGFTQSSKLNLPLNEKPAMPVEDHNNMKSISLGKTEKVLNCSSCHQDNTNNESRSGSRESSTCSCTQMGSPVAEVRGLPFGLKVPRKKRSVLKQYYLTSIGRLRRQLLQILHEQQSQSTNSCNAAAVDDDLLFMPNSMMISSNETALGAMLLK